MAREGWVSTQPTKAARNLGHDKALVSIPPDCQRTTAISDDPRGSSRDFRFFLTVTDFGGLDESSPLAGEDRPRSGQMRGTTRETTVGIRGSPSRRPWTSMAFWLAPPHPALRATFPREGGRPLCPPPPKSVTVRVFRRPSGIPRSRRADADALPGSRELQGGT